MFYSYSAWRYAITVIPVFSGGVNHNSTPQAGVVSGSSKLTLPILLHTVLTPKN